MKNKLIDELNSVVKLKSSEDPQKMQSAKYQSNVENGNIFNAEGGSVYVNHPPQAERKFDDSALQQGRRALRTREVGESVHPKHMTPKEYRNFSVGLWDGIETRPDLQDWSAWEWPEEAELKPKKPAERRTPSSRRKGQSRYSGKNKRKNSRRSADKVNAVHEAVLYYCGIGIGYAVLFILIILTLSKGVF